MLVVRFSLSSADVVAFVVGRWAMDLRDVGRRWPVRLEFWRGEAMAWDDRDALYGY